MKQVWVIKHKHGPIHGAYEDEVRARRIFEEFQRKEPWTYSLNQLYVDEVKEQPKHEVRLDVSLLVEGREPTRYERQDYARAVLRAITENVRKRGKRSPRTVVRVSVSAYDDEFSINDQP